MVKLDISHMRYMNTEDFRVLTAFETGSRNHEVVPVNLATQISGLKSSAVKRSIAELAKIKLLARMKNTSYDGYRLTYHGYDFLALKALVKRDTVFAVGNQVGIGKESDIYVIQDNKGIQNILKIHRLGRISFRTVKNNRDYLKTGQSASWMYLSRLAAQKEFAFMKILHEHGFPVPVPIDQSRHHVVMSLVDGFPMRQLKEHSDPSRLYSLLMSFIVRLANHGLIHCDFNEFNIMIRENYENPEDEFVVIDFPQCISTSHVDAKRYFERDVDCIRRFFEKKLGYIAEDYPRFDRDITREENLDLLVEASGFSKKQVKELEKAMAISREIKETEGGESYGDDDEEEEEEEEEEGYGEGNNDEREEEEAKEV